MTFDQYGFRGERFDQFGPDQELVKRFKELLEQVLLDLSNENQGYDLLEFLAAEVNGFNNSWLRGLGITQTIQNTERPFYLDDSFIILRIEEPATEQSITTETIVVTLGGHTAEIKNNDTSGLGGLSPYLRQYCNFLETLEEIVSQIRNFQVRYNRYRVDFQSEDFANSIRDWRGYIRDLRSDYQKLVQTLSQPNTNLVYKNKSDLVTEISGKLTERIKNPKPILPSKLTIVRIGETKYPKQGTSEAIVETSESWTDAQAELIARIFVIGLFLIAAVGTWSDFQKQKSLPTQPPQPTNSQPFDK